MRGWVVSACAALLLVAAAAVAPASNGAQHAAAVTLTLQAPTATPHTLVAPTKAECEAAQAAVLGKACVDRRGMILANEWVTVQDGRAQMIHPNQWDISFSWTVPQSIPATGAAMKLELSAKELTRGANARICPAMGVRGGFALKEGGVLQGQPVQVDVCAQAGGTAPASKTVTLVPGTATAGSFVYLTVGIQDGPVYTYKYKAVAAPSKCRALSAVGKTPECRYRVNFVFTQGGRRPARMPAWVTDVATAGTGTAQFVNRRGQSDIKTMSARVVRTMEIAKPDPDTGIAIRDVRLVFRATSAREATFERGRASVFFLLVESDDPLCPVDEDGSPRVAFVGLYDGDGKRPDVMFLKVSGCPHHTATFTGSLGPRSAV
jgi:hypothetical protein